jgi:hypothetical protein
VENLKPIWPSESGADSNNESATPYNDMGETFIRVFDVQRERIRHHFMGTGTCDVMKNRISNIHKV